MEPWIALFCWSDIICPWRNNKEHIEIYVIQIKFALSNPNKDDLLSWVIGKQVEKLDTEPKILNSCRKSDKIFFLLF